MLYYNQFIIRLLTGRVKYNNNKLCDLIRIDKCAKLSYT